MKFRLLLLGLLAWGGGPAVAQTVAPFTIIGPIERFTLDCTGDPLCPAHMRVSGVDIVLPRNLIVQTPTQFFSPVRLFAANPKGPGESGLALADIQKPIGAYTAEITGNIVNGTYIAGLVGITQVPLAAGAGYVRAIGGDGTIVVGPSPLGGPAQPGDTRLRLNDPVGRFAPKAVGPAFDRRFAVDDEAPSVHALTGFPLCIQASGVGNCPTANRPVAGGRPLSLFVMGTAPLPPSPPDGPIIPACPGCDATREAPLRVGDYVTYAGVLSTDGAGPFIAAYELVANLGIYTAPGSKPAYAAVESSLIGTMGQRTQRAGGGFIPQETKDRLRVVGFTTDPSRSVSIYAIDIDPGSGVKHLRRIGQTVPDDVPFGRFRYLVGKRAGALAGPAGIKGATRELLIRIDDGQNLENKPVPVGPLSRNGLVAGQYITPVGEYIFPENTVLGDTLVQNNFECLAFLQRGSGPLDGTGPIVGRLFPWPGSGAPAGAVQCGP